MAVANDTRPPRPAVIRKLGHLENYHSAWHTLRHLIGVVIVCRYTVPSNNNNTSDLKDVFEHAVAQTVLQHPLLRVGILDATSKKPSWLRLLSLDLASHMTWQTLDCTSEQDYETRLQAIIDWHHDTEFTDLDTKPGWRMTMLQRRMLCNADAKIEPFVEVVFSWNHPNFDGMGGKIFHETLLANLNKTVLSDAGCQPPLKDHVLDLSSDYLTKDNFTPNLHDITKLPVTPGFTMKTAWKELKPAKKHSSPPRSSSPSTAPQPAADKIQTHGASWCPIVADGPYKTHTLRSHALDGPALDKVLSLCRQQPNGGITLTALLHALCLSSMAPLFPIKTADGKGTIAAAPGSFDAATAVNFRRFLKPSPPGYPDLKPSRTMANYVSTLEHRFGPEIVAEIRTAESAAAEPASPLSDAARQAIFHAADQIKRDLSARIDRGVKNDQVGLMALVGDWRAQHTANTKKSRHGAWNVSNIGVIDGNPTGDTHVDDADEHAKQAWRITKSWFTVGAMVTSGVFMISPVAVKGQGLFLGCTWQDGVVDRKFAEQFFARLDARLKDLAR